MYLYILLLFIIIITVYCLYKYITEFDINKIYEYPDILSDQQCNEIILLAEPHISNSTVIGENGNDEPDNRRTSQNTFLSRTHKVVQDIYDKLSKIIGIDSDHFEQLQVVRYEPGQKYEAHWDACYEEGKCDEFIKQGGQRYATFLLYLNDDFTDGETEFPYRNIKIKPVKGKAALFFNLEKDNKTKLDDSFHAGLPPTSGIKWLCNVWIRLNKIPDIYQ